jgi:hypothetical protein
LQTPKPPGGWLRTPQPAEFAEDTVLDETDIPVPNVTEDNIPETPIAPTRFVIKTPKPPGGWATPAPISLKSGESEDNDQRSQLLTPVNSLSRGSTLNPKTPGVPGGWVNTPGARKSFDPQSPEVKGAYAQGSAPESRGEESELDSPSLPSPHNPRRPKANIRVLDAFGRAETSSSSPKKEINASRNNIRVLDAMGRDFKEEESEEQGKMEESTTPPTRAVLLSRLRRGLDELAEDINVVDGCLGFIIPSVSGANSFSGKKISPSLIVRVSKN